jgi:hypothetical protein
MFSRNADGMLEISEANRELILSSEDYKANLLEAASLMGELTYKKSNLNVEKEDLLKLFNHTGGVGGTYSYSYKDEQGNTYSSEEPIDDTYFLDYNKLFSDDNLKNLMDLREDEFE